MSGLVGFMCEWGTKCGTEEDDKVCTQRAVGVVGVKDGGGMHKLYVCMAHRAELIRETGPT